MAHQHMHRTKPPPVEMGHLANQINAMPVAPAAESQKREIVAKLNDLATQMKHWAVQVEGFASHLNTLSVSGQPQKYPSGAPSANDARGGPSSANGQYAAYSNPGAQHYASSAQYQFQVQQQYPQSGRPPSTGVEYPSKAPTPDESEKPGKRRRRTDSTRRKKDPLAPKRPPSAYILYQNDVRKQMQDKYPDMPYSEVLGKISESWQTLEEGKKKVYLDLVERDKVRYEDEKLRYNSGQEVPLKPTPRRPLASLRTPSDFDAEGEVEGEPEPEPEDAGEEEVTGQDEQEQPGAKRTKLEDGPAPNSQASSHQEYAQVQRQTPAPPQQSPQYPPQSVQQMHYTQHVTPYGNTQPRIPPPSPHAQAPRASPHLAHMNPQLVQGSPQATHTQATHLSPQAAHATPQPRASPAASSPHASQSSPQPHHIGVSPRLVHVPPANIGQMPHLTQFPQHAAIPQLPQHQHQPGPGMSMNN